MKNTLRTLAIITFLFVATALSAQQHTVADLAGKWDVTEGTTGTVEFLEGSKVTVSISGLQMPATSYTVDFSKDPIWFDVFITTSRAVKGLMQFVDANTIKWQIFLDDNRPVDFTTGAPGPMILKRKI